LRKRKPKRKSRLRKTNHTEEEFYALCEAYNFRCVSCCDKLEFSEMTRDHIIPTSRGGVDYIWNIQPMCERCNSTKGSRYADFRPFIPIWVAEKEESFRKKNRK
jgi:5-methylcytosine-specific restriction endonuclease McrA